MEMEPNSASWNVLMKLQLRETLMVAMENTLSLINIVLRDIHRCSRNRS